LRFRIEIDRLVLHGFNNKHDTDHIDQDIEKELARLIAEKDGIKKNKVINSRDAEINRIDGGAFHLGSDHSISKLAAASIAKSIYSVMDSKK
jgi:hypothetical protein